MARPVQLAPGSLALVLCRLEAQEAAGTVEEPGGRAVFRAFRRANARCFWNAKLARAASRLAFQGWLRRGVLLVHAPASSLQVLRDAWRRRALRPPRGFHIRAVGDVFPVQMNPIAQSQFVPLTEVLCCAISDMNAAQIVVTQESLLEHLMKHHPGIAIPSQDILYSTLGTLIKERKIYHTGEGYFIVTPQTYFITKTAQENKRVLLSDESHLVPASVTYLVSMENCAESTKENAVPVTHCRSCQCFPDIRTQGVEEPPTAADMSRKGQKGLEESTPLVQNQTVSLSEENHICESPKPLPCTKDKEKGKKFGFSVLWRSISRKEKPKTEHSSFSAQFPPEEWPVRDEDNLDNIPRDVEHEIIRRINPILTVDNLIKHTVLMQKCEEQKKYNSQGTSTDMLSARLKYPSKEGVKKRHSRSIKKTRRWGHSHRHRHKVRSWGSDLQPGSVRLERYPKLPDTQPGPRIKSPNEVEVQKPLVENPTVLDSHLIYKKRISNPFQGLSLRRSPITKGYNIQKINDLKPNQIGPKEQPFQKSRPSDSSRIFDEVQQPYPEPCHDKPKAESIYVTNSTVQPVSDDFRADLLNSPQCSVLQNDHQCCSFRESMLRYDTHGGENKVISEVLRKSHSHFDKSWETKETWHILPSRGSSSVDPTSSASRLVDKTIHQFQNLGLLDYPADASYLRQSERQDRDSEDLMKKAFVQEAETASLENEGLSEDDQALYQDEVEDDNGACSSLYLEEDDFSENDGLCQMLPRHTQYSFLDRSKWNHLERPQVTERSLTEHNSKMDRFELQSLTRNECYKPTGLLINPDERQNQNLSPEICTQFDFNDEEPSVTKCDQASAPADGSLFDYYSARKPNSEAEILQDSVGDTVKKSVSQCPQNQEMGKLFTQKLELFNASCMPVLAQDIQHEQSLLEGTENQSMAGDSGIDSPRTQSMASNNSVILDGLKRRQNCLQNFEGTKRSQALTSSSLLQLTPVINV
ncbi:Storkhead-box protein 1 [Sciurus carolinensis]|uniref:Storkhead-box protein 1 n=1 Tax=Sciurus carolinensis TaxID=30640 RepID=A0AA41N935_SCICA|nr:storkhead-box protein 1 [Sciurus carolinensis]MBZ3885908.1 Storkhead-box protein 1 [Sciurus carolinensis]